MPKNAPIYKCDDRVRHECSLTESGACEILTIDALEPAAWWGIYVVTVRAVKFNGIQARQVRPAAGYDVGPVTIDTGACTEDPLLVFVHLMAELRHS